MGGLNHFKKGKIKEKILKENLSTKCIVLL